MTELYEPCVSHGPALGNTLVSANYSSLVFEAFDQKL